MRAKWLSLEAQVESPLTPNPFISLVNIHFQSSVENGTVGQRWTWVVQTELAPDGWGDVFIFQNGRFCAQELDAWVPDSP